MIMVPAKEQQLLDCLTDAVREALERKRRLGQYAVIWHEGQSLLIGNDAPGTLVTEAAATTPANHDAGVADQKNALAQ